MSDFKYQWCSQCRESCPMRGEAYHALEKCGNIFFCPQGHRMHITQDDIVRQQRDGDYGYYRCGCGELIPNGECCIDCDLLRDALEG